MSLDSAPHPAPTSEEGMPSPLARTVVSLLLFLHLAALLFAVAANFRPVSRLRSNLGNVPITRQYASLLLMNTAYNYHLTYADLLDTDHFAEVELDWKGKTAGDNAHRLSLPDDPKAGPSLRNQRYRNLLLNAASQVDNDATAGVLPNAISKKLLAEAELRWPDADIRRSNHRFRLHRHLLVPRNNVQSHEASQSDPYHRNYYATPYEADLRFVGDEMILTKAARAAETAPVQRSQ